MSCSQCSSPKLRKDPTNDNDYPCKNERRTCLRVVKERNENSDEEEQGLSSLNCTELRDICSSHGLPKSGVKDDLVSRITTFVQGLSSIDDDAIENFEDENEDLLTP